MSCCGAQNLLLAYAHQILTAATPFCSLFPPPAAVANVPTSISLHNYDATACIIIMELDKKRLGQLVVRIHCAYPTRRSTSSLVRRRVWVSSPKAKYLSMMHTATYSKITIVKPISARPKYYITLSEKKQYQNQKISKYFFNSLFNTQSVTKNSKKAFTFCNFYTIIYL